MSQKKIIIIFAVITFALLIGGVTLLSSGSSTSAKITSSQNAKALVPEKNYDWGNIPMQNGNVTKTFAVRNTGSEVLKITKVKTSCHCTKAQFKIGDSTSPYFGMNNVSSWIGEVAPGQEAQMEVIFDPAYHGPQGVGPINRLVSIETNDANNSRIEFSLTGTVFK